ncbi:unnamed protein product [Didymodactylos carnosus]|uniref:Uncharacterized protein n=1 Tax=Didymodactylos carnosus TaxID=1234261 RepID=A0A813UGG2_9BILA|nr:unnamed protein product [Didymodactylos carnosus]CAF0826524.1 unnamed protein product [Didymodactylos carnosus]CAF3498305.1 unnamed protein product [Didymodactylos carnosus]CAF3613368.1 unnamed protein product [Didymodactylos carnosus]
MFTYFKKLLFLYFFNLSNGTCEFKIQDNENKFYPCLYDRIADDKYKVNCTTVRYNFGLEGLLNIDPCSFNVTGNINEKCLIQELTFKFLYTTALMNFTTTVDEFFDKNNTNNNKLILFIVEHNSDLIIGEQHFQQFIPNSLINDYYLNLYRDNKFKFKLYLDMNYIDTHGPKQIRVQYYCKKQATIIYDKQQGN